jgi:hypothetical protein
MLTINERTDGLFSARRRNTYARTKMDAAQQLLSEQVTSSAKKIAHNVNARYALTATAFLVAVITAWAALLWIWFSRTIKVPDLPPIVPPVGAASDKPEDNKAQCEVACTRANTKNLEGPMWLAIAGAIAALALFIAALTIPSLQDYLQKIRAALTSGASGVATRRA